MAIESEVLEIGELEKSILLLVYVDDEPVQSRRKLQLLMYMLGEPYKEIREFGNFIIKDDGPYSKILERDLEHLLQMKLLSEDNSIKLTEHGKDIAKCVEREKGAIKDKEAIFDIRIPQVFSNYKSIVNDVTVSELLSYMYCEYPDMAKGSVTYEKLKPDIKEHIFSLVEKEKFGNGKAAALLDIPRHLMMEEMGKRGLLRLES